MNDLFDEDLYDDDVYDDYDDDADELEAYCMTCKQKNPIDDPEPIWTRRGTPGTRGTCSVCGTIVFRMGRTAAHGRLKRPAPVQLSGESTHSRGGSRKTASAAITYINYSVSDAEFAEILAEDLERIGVKTWLASSAVDDVHWATGVHPALVECKHMVVVLTPLAIKATNVNEALRFFLDAHKPVIVAQLHPSELPDGLRRKPRFDFTGDDYKQQFRELVQALSD